MRKVIYVEEYFLQSSHIFHFHFIPILGAISRKYRENHTNGAGTGISLHQLRNPKVQSSYPPACFLYTPNPLVVNNPYRNPIFPIKTGYHMNASFYIILQINSSTKLFLAGMPLTKPYHSLMQVSIIFERE